MVFVTGKLLWLAFRVSTLLALAGLAGAALLLSGRARWGRHLAVAALAAPLLLILPVHHWALMPLESRFPRVEHAPDRVDGIVVLGGAVDTLLTARHGIPSLNDAAERMTTFAALARRYSGARLAFTGGNGLLSPGSLSEADVARALFDQLGVPRSVVYEDRSRTTYENAVLLRDEVRPRPGEVWVLLTSAAHMPRSVGTFRAAGWTVLPWPVGYKAGAAFSTRLDQGLPERMQAIDVAAHEWAGLLAYRLLGRTDALFPGPAP